MTLAIMVQGTASDVGKSVLVAGLCRIFSRDGRRCAPFKSQNMALNSGITADGKEMGRAQIFQAEAAGIEPDVRMNPVLLKPTSDSKAQVILMGKVATDMDARRYHEYKPQLKARIQTVYRSLAAEQDVMVLEGAGSPAEINLRDRDIVNMGMAELAQCPVILVADIDRGGVFAAIYGTLALLQDHERWRVKGVIINKFRGDVALLKPGLEQIEALTGVPVIGVMPWLDIDLEDEDGVAIQRGKYHAARQQALDIAVLKLPHISNFTDFNPLAAQPDTRVRYISHPGELDGADLVILPGSKNTLGDLHWLHSTGMASAMLDWRAAGKPVFGICGGYQMLGRQISDDIESGLGTQPGLGLLDMLTKFAHDKVTVRTRASVLPGLLGGAGGHPVSGYEIHMGTTLVQPGTRPLLALENGGEDGAISKDGLVAGCYLHGIFDNTRFTRALLDTLRQRKGLAPWEGEIVDYRQWKDNQFNQLADAMCQHIDIDRLYQIMQQHQEPA